MRANDRSERAWAKATQLAEGVEDHGVGSALRRYFTRWWPVVALVSFGGGFFSIRLLEDGSAGPLVAIQSGFLVAALASMISGYVYWWRRIRPLVQPQRMPITSWLGTSDAKWVLDQILGRRPVMPEHLPVLRGAAAQLRAGMSLTLSTTVSSLFMAAAFAVGFPGPVMRTIWAVLFLVNACLLAYSVRRFRSAGRFLDATDPHRPRAEAAAPED